MDSTPDHLGASYPRHLRSRRQKRRECFLHCPVLPQSLFAAVQVPQQAQEDALHSTQISFLYW